MCSGYLCYKNYYVFYMSKRFELYQNSIRKFIHTQSVITDCELKDKILAISDKSEYILPITLLTIINGQQRRNKLSTVHGYEMATGIELLTILLQILEMKSDNVMCTTLVSLINISLNRNINLIMQHHQPQNINNIFSICIEQLNKKICKITDNFLSCDKYISEYTSNTSYPNSDLNIFHFKNPSAINNLRSIRTLPKDIVIKYITETHGNICKLSLILGWIIGGSPHNMITNLERLGYHFSLLIKIAYDFANIDSDIEKCTNNGVTLNYVINFGLQDAYELFDESRKKFIEGTMTLGITSTTIKEFIDILNTKVNTAIDQSSPDIQRSSSVSSS